MGSMQKYTVQKKIGTGSYGSAYLVTRNENKGRNDTKLVLKRINVKDASKEEKQAAHFEAKILKEFRHPYVLSCKDSFQHGPYMCIITDYCDAGDLYERLKKQAQRGQHLDEKHILRWLAQITTALKYVHEKNLLHRDLKTQNIFLTAKGDIMLGDFGIARVLKSKRDMARTVIGTPYYMSPEILESRPYSYKSDLWSLGCILFEMMSIKHAFDANDMNGLVMKIIRGRIPPLPGKYSPELKQLTTALLSKVPSRRPSLDSILKMKFLQGAVKAVDAAVAGYHKERAAAGGHHKVLHPLAGGALPNGHHNKSIPDMRKQLHIQMQRNGNGCPSSREKPQAPMEPRKVRAKPQAPKARPLAEARGARRGEPSLDIAVDIAEQRLKNIHKEFRAVRVQAKKLEDAVNIPDEPAAAQGRHRLRQKEAGAAGQGQGRPGHRAGGRPHAPGRKVVRAPEPRRLSREEAARGLGASPPREKRRSPTPAAPAPAPVSAKERARDARLQRKMEANRRYEEQLEEARRSYFQEKKAAALKKQDLYKESNSPPRPSPYEQDVQEVRNLVEYQHERQGPDFGYGGAGPAAARELEMEGGLGDLGPIQEERDREREQAEAERRYEEQLEEARMEYYLEKRAALEKKQGLYRESAASPPPPARREDGDGAFVVREEMVYAAAAAAAAAPPHAPPHAPPEVVDPSPEFQVEESFVYSAIPEEGEGEGGAPASEDIDTGVFAQGGVVDKVNAIRDYCLEKLGSVLFHELCGLIKLHNSRALTSTSDVEYAGEILERLGEPRIHFAGLIDHLLYLEEQLY